MAPAAGVNGRAGEPARASFHETIEGDLRVVRMSLRVDGERAPGVFWMPDDLDEPAPLVIIQHPLMSSKDEYFVADTARAWAPRGWICGGLDAPLHGDRDDYAPLDLLKQPERFPGVRRQFTAEVSAAIDELSARYPVDDARIGYAGFSLGAQLGVAAVAGDGRFRAAVLCLTGEGGLAGPATGPDSHTRRLAAPAVRIVGKTGDEIVPREATLALYDAIEGTKDITWLPGSHFDIGQDVIAVALDWLREHLA